MSGSLEEVLDTVVHVHGRDGLLSTIPTILGFYPADSLVIIGIRGERFRIGPTGRVDLKNYLDNPDLLADQLARALSTHVDQVILVFYGWPADVIGFDEMLRARGLPVFDTLFADNAKHELNPLLQAEYALRGHVVENDRQSVAARVEYDADARTPADVSVLRSMSDSAHRDEYLAAHIGSAPDTLPSLLAVCRWVADSAPEVANLCAVAGILAYRTGEGALSQICLDRALRIDKNHTLAKLMVQFLGCGIPPEELEDVASSCSS